MKITFMLKNKEKILDFELCNLNEITNVNIYSDKLTSAILMGKKLSADNLLELFKYYTSSNYTLQEYINLFKEYEFYSILQPNLRMTIE